MKNEDNENFDLEDRSFYSEGQRVSQDNTEKTEPLNIDENQGTNHGGTYNGATSQDENNPQKDNVDNSLQNDFYRNPDKTDSGNDSERRTLDEYNANEYEPEEDNGLERAELDNINSNEDSDPLNDNYDSYDNEAEDDDVKENNLRDAFNDDDLEDRDQSNFSNEDFDKEDKIRYSDENLEKQNPNINDPDPFQPKRF
jgi:hypothetical protein